MENLPDNYINKRTLDINIAAVLIKTMPTNTAIQHIKSKLSGKPETEVIKGKLLVMYFD